MSIQHYVFAHKVLPEHLWAGDSVLGILANPENQDFLHKIWDDVPRHPSFEARSRHVARQLESLNSPESLSFEQMANIVSRNPDDIARVVAPSGLSYESFWLGGQHLVVLITLPPPGDSLEAYFIAITHSPEVRYLTLERFALGGTMLCEWTRTQHLNYDTGPEPEVTQFLRAVCRILKIPETVEAPTRQQLQGMAKVAMYYGEIPEPLSQHDAAQVEQWGKMADDAITRWRNGTGSWWSRWLKSPSGPTRYLVEAETLYRRIYAFRLNVQGVENTEATTAAWPLVSVLNAQGKYAEALALCQTWWEQCRRHRMPGHEETSNATKQLAETFQKMGDFDAAERMWSYRAQFFGLTRGIKSTQAQRARDDLGKFSQQRAAK